MMLSQSPSFPLASIPCKCVPHKLKPVLSILNDRSLVFPSVSIPKCHAINSKVEEIEEERRDVTEGNLPRGLRRENMPNHVAVILDGNGRWAKQRNLPLSLGHEAGYAAFRNLCQNCIRWGIPVLTVFAFSMQNWSRPKMEVEFLMSLLENSIKQELDYLKKEGIQLSLIGDPSKLPKSLLKVVTDAKEATKNNKRLQLVVAVSYTGQYDIVQACQSIAHKVKHGLIQPEDIDEYLVEQQLQTNCTDFPYPDLLIRTSGELRLSNFLLWQLAYTELFFAQCLWPDFGEDEFLEALYAFQQRQRRYGKRVP